MNAYFDLEYDPRLNKDKTGDEVVNALLRVLDKFLKEIFAVQLTFDYVVELDSSRAGEIRLPCDVHQQPDVPIF